MSGDGGAGITSGYILDRVTVRPGRLGEGPLVVVARIRRGAGRAAVP